MRCVQINLRRKRMIPMHPNRNPPQSADDHHNVGRAEIADQAAGSVPDHKPVEKQCVRQAGRTRRRPVEKFDSGINILVFTPNAMHEQGNRVTPFCQLSAQSSKVELDRIITQARAYQNSLLRRDLHLIHSRSSHLRGLWDCRAAQCQTGAPHEPQSGHAHASFGLRTSWTIPPGKSLLRDDGCRNDSKSQRWNN